MRIARSGLMIHGSSPKLTPPRIVLALLLVAPGLPLVAAPADPRLERMPRVEDDTVLRWADGPPSYLGSKDPPPSEVLCLQSGTWGLAFDTRKVQSVRAGRRPDAMPVAEAVKPRRTALDELPGAEWQCAIVAAGRRYTCIGDRRASCPVTGSTSLHLLAFGAEVTPALQVAADPALKLEKDDSLGRHVIRLPEQPWTNARGTYYPEEHLDRLDRWPIEIRDDSDRPVVARLLFQQTNHPAITGFTPIALRARRHADRAPRSDLQELAPAPRERVDPASRTWRRTYNLPLTGERPCAITMYPRVPE